MQRPVAEAATRRPGRTSKTQLKLFNAAMEIMGQRGPEFATVEEVAQLAGVSKGTVYYNFGSTSFCSTEPTCYYARWRPPLRCIATPVRR